MEIEQNQISAFDMGFSTLGRINYLLWQCNESSTKDDAIGWFRSVKNLYKEADTYMGSEERKEHAGKFKQIEVAYGQFLNYHNQFKHGTYNPPRAVFDLLFSWEIDLRRILDKKGLLMKKGENSAKAMI